MIQPTPSELADLSAARTLADVGCLVAEWLEGRRTWSPTYYGTGPDPETAPHIVEAVARVNRAGWVTASSQPGLSAGTLHQRAYVEGLVDSWIASYAEHLAIDTELVTVHVGRAPTRPDDLVSIPVTAVDGRGHTWLGRWDAHDDDALLDAPLHPDAVAAVRAADALQVFDPVWGRDDLLWPWLRRLAGDLADGTALAWIGSALDEGADQEAP